MARKNRTRSSEDEKFEFSNFPILSVIRMAGVKAGVFLVIGGIVWILYSVATKEEPASGISTGSMILGLGASLAIFSEILALAFSFHRSIRKPPED